MRATSLLRHDQSEYGKLISRRGFVATLGAAGAVVASGCVASGNRPPPIIDTHTHFYDPARPQGVPWPPKNDSILLRPVYPPEFLALASPHGVQGTVVVEASPWLEDNQWVLDLAKEHPCIWGVVGNIKPGNADFASALKRFRRNSLFRGIRVGVWERSALAEAVVIRDLQQLADAGLALDVLTGPDRLMEVAQLAKSIPGLRIVIDHCANVRIDGQSPSAAWLDGLRACAAEPNVFMKVSGLVEGSGRNDGSAPTSVSFYRPVLEAVWTAFGEDRVIFGSNWPVSARFASYETVFNVVAQFARERGCAAATKYFYRNATIAYGLRIP